MSLLRSFQHINSLVNRCAAVSIPFILSSDFPLEFDRLHNGNLLNYQQVRFAKRKGYRLAKQREHKKKAAARRLLEKKSETKFEWKPKFMLIDKSALKVGPRRFDDSKKADHPVDDVYCMEGMKAFRYNVEEAIEMHRETHHPTIYNEPNAMVEARIELNLRTKKKTKFISEFDGIVTLPNNFDYPRNRRIVAIVKTESDAEKALEAGASIAGGKDIIKMIKDGLLTKDDYEELVVHGDMLLPLTEIRGILKKDFPSKAKGNYGLDIPGLIKKFLVGFDYELTRDDYELNFGWVDAPIGRLQMEAQQIEENLVTLCEELEKYKAQGVKEEFDFITRVVIKSPPSEEEIMIRYWELLDDYEDPNAPKEEDEEGEDDEDQEIVGRDKL